MAAPGLAMEAPETRARHRHAAALGLTDVAEEARLKAADCPPRTAWESYALGRSLLDDGDWLLPHLADGRLPLERACLADLLDLDQLRRLVDGRDDVLLALLRREPVERHPE